MSFSPSVFFFFFFIPKTEAYLLTTVLPRNNMCGERFGFAHQCFNLERQRCRFQTRANQITPCCWNTVKCAHTWQALSKDASPSVLLQRSRGCYISIICLPFSSEGGWRSTAKQKRCWGSLHRPKAAKLETHLLLAPESWGSNKLFLFALLCNTHLFSDLIRCSVCLIQVSCVSPSVRSWDVPLLRRQSEVEAIQARDCLFFFPSQKQNKCLLDHYCPV